MADPKISKQRAVVQGGWVLCPVTWAKIGALEKGAHGSGVAPYCPKCKASHPVILKEPYRPTTEENSAVGLFSFVWR